MASKLNIQEIESTTGTLKVAGNVQLDMSGSNDFMDIPAGTSDQRGTPEEGAIRWNYDYDSLEVYNGTAWKQFNKPYDGDDIVKAGLILNLDATNRNSYPGNGETWYDLSGKNAHAVAEDGDLPVFVDNGNQSYFQFNGTSHEMVSVDISQDYQDVCVLMELSSSQPSLPMLFNVYPDLDASIRFNGGSGLWNPGNVDDWHTGNLDEIFINGLFSQSGVDVRDRWVFLRTYRTNTSEFNNSFRYQLSSDFLNRRYAGKISALLAYERKLTNEEVLQNYNTLRDRVGV